MRPNGEEVVRGVAASLMTYILPEIDSAYARMQLMIAIALLGVVASEWDVAAQRLVDDNAGLRSLAGRAADELAQQPAADSLRAELRALAAEADASLHLSDLSAAGARLRGAIGRLGVLLVNSEAPALRSLRSEVIETLRAQAEARSLSLLGPRADG